MVTYGLCKHHMENARLSLAAMKHDAVMRHLRAVYEGRRRIHDSLHAEDK